MGCEAGHWPSDRRGSFSGASLSSLLSWCKRAGRLPYWCLGRSGGLNRRTGIGECADFVRDYYRDPLPHSPSSTSKLLNVCLEEKRLSYPYMVAQVFSAPSLKTDSVLCLAGISVGLLDFCKCLWDFKLPLGLHQAFSPWRLRIHSPPFADVGLKALG